MRKRITVARILRIHQIDGFRITCVFNTGDYKTINFEKLLKNVQEGDPEYSLKDLNTFRKVIVNDSQTLSWPNVMVSFTSLVNAGEVEQAPLDLDPLVLFKEGEPFKPDSIHVGEIMRKARLRAGLTQSEIAKKSGTTKAYISRIENGRSGIEIDTLQKIVKEGLGTEIQISIVEPTRETSFLTTFNAPTITNNEKNRNKSNNKER